MSLARYYVFERGPVWIVALDGEPIRRHRSQSEALNSAIVMADLMGAMSHEADVMVESAGQLDIAWTYGTDALPEGAQP